MTKSEEYRGHLIEKDIDKSSEIIINGQSEFTDIFKTNIRGIVLTAFSIEEIKELIDVGLCCDSPICQSCSLEEI